MPGFVRFLCLSISFFSLCGPLSAQNILPPRPEAIGGGNPFEGLGRPDDPNPSRRDEFENKTSGTGEAANPAAIGGTGTGTDETIVDGSPGNPPDPTQAAAESQKKNRRSLFESPENSAPKGSQPGASPLAAQALSLMQNGHYEEASRNLEALLHVYPRAPELDYLLGVSLTMSCRFEEAKKHYQLVLDSGAPERLKELARKGLLKLHH